MPTPVSTSVAVHGPVDWSIFMNMGFLVGVGAIVIIAIFILLASLIIILNYEPSPVHERLRLFREKGVFQGSEGGKITRSGFDDLQDRLLEISKPIANNMYGQNLKYQKQVKLQLCEAGLPDNEENVNRFLTRRAATGLVASAIAFCVGMVIGPDPLMSGLLGLIGGFLIGSMIPQFGLKGRAKKRKENIKHTLPDTLDLMVVCVEAGLSMDATLNRVVDDMDKLAPDLTYELRRLNKELNAGIPRSEAYQAMALRAGVDELRTLCTQIVQSDRMGTSIAETLRIYSGDLRMRRRQAAEELAAKASVKLTFPLVLFVFPPLFIILLGPVVISTLSTFQAH